MARSPQAPIPLTAAEARRLWLRAQRLDTVAPFGAGPGAVRAATEQLGYVQIDTINVVERSHHHILWTRIPEYRRADLAGALGDEKSVFEYWTHALAYVPVRDYRFFVPEMRRMKVAPDRWYESVTPRELRGILRRVRDEGALTIRDIDDDVLVDKDHLWASRKPSKRALQLAFFRGDLTVSARDGMLKRYELTDRHFGWPPRPRPATPGQVIGYLLDRALRAQVVVSLDSIARLPLPRKAALVAEIADRVRRRRLVPAVVAGAERTAFWVDPAALAEAPGPLPDDLAHVLSPFDPLVIQRRRLEALFGYEHRFEAYVPAAQRVKGYFALPVLVGDRIVAAIDTKADRENRKLLIQKWTWVGEGDDRLRPVVEEALGRFERFQFGA